MSNSKYIVATGDNSILITDETFSDFWESDLIHYTYLINSKETFFGFPNVEQIATLPKVNIVGIPYNSGSNSRESKVKNFVNTLRKISSRTPIFPDYQGNGTSGLYNLTTGKIALKNVILNDLGDIHLNNESLSELDDIISDSINDHTSIGFVGGDHSVTYNILKSIRKNQPNKVVVVQFDAHHDCGRDRLKDELNVHHGNFVRKLLEEDVVAAVIQVGVRGFRSIKQVYTHPKLFQIPGTNFSPCQLKFMIKHLEEREGEFQTYVSFDVDVLDPSDFDLVDFPISGGPSIASLKKMIHTIFHTKSPVIGFDLVEGHGDGPSYKYEPVLQIFTELLDYSARQ